jgi:integrase/recombinase XerD
MTALGNSDTTVGIYARSLRAIYNYGISKGIISDKEYPFGKGKYVIPGGRNIKKALTLDEVARIYNYETVKGTSVDKAKDFWFLSYFCNGINFKDILLLKNKNIDGEMLRFVRQKTKNTTRANPTVISCYISEPVRDIINKWRNKNEYPTSYLFNFIEVQDDVIKQTKKISNFIHNTNDHMKRICKDLGISKLATTYYSRHSAATIMKKSGASVEQIREALGHQNTSTTQKYLDSFDDETKKTLSQELSKFLQKEVPEGLPFLA